jgi:hypothetical protein
LPALTQRRWRRCRLICGSKSQRLERPCLWATRPPISWKCPAWARATCIPLSTSPDLLNPACPFVRAGNWPRANPLRPSFFSTPTPSASNKRKIPCLKKYPLTATLRRRLVLTIRMAKKLGHRKLHDLIAVPHRCPRSLTRSISVASITAICPIPAARVGKSSRQIREVKNYRPSRDRGVERSVARRPTTARGSDGKTGSMNILHCRPAWLSAPQPRRRRRRLAGLWAAIGLLRSPVPAADHAHSAAQCGRAKTIPQADSTNDSISGPISQSRSKRCFMIFSLVMTSPSE